MIDHLVYCCRDMDAAIRGVEGPLGVRFSPGGTHEARGTMNRLLRIGPETYLELLMIDAENTAVASPRWMGIDLLPEASPGILTRWALAVDGRQLPKFNFTPPPFEAGQRRLADGSTLRWQLTDPSSEPLVDPTPFLIDWLGQSSPANRLPDVGCQLTRLIIGTPDTGRLTGLVTGAVDLELIQASQPFIEAHILSPKGEVQLT